MPLDDVLFASAPTRRELFRLRPIEFGLVALLALAATVALQFAAGAHGAEFGDDEASHYVSGLLVHDYLLHGLPHSPIAYLKQFHSHYPLVGIGHWPPLYYGVEAVWMLLFSASRSSMLLLSAVVTAATATLSYGFVARRLGRLAGLFAALAFVVVPIVQKSSSELMLDVPVALTSLLAMIVYVRYLETESAWSAVLFALLAVAAMMVKGNGACLALLPPFAVLIGRRFDLLLKPSFWLPLPIVGVLTGPWYWLTYGQAEAGFRYHWGWDYLATATTENGAILLTTLGPVVLIAAAIGAVAMILAPYRRTSGSWLVGTLALFAAIWTFQSLVPAAIQDRYLAQALPPLLMLALWGAWVCGDLVAGRIASGSQPHRLAGALSVLVLAVALAPQALHLWTKPHRGYREAAQAAWAARRDDNPAVLIVADGLGEASTVAELAMADPHRPSLFAVRGSRLLGGGGYNREDYVPRFETPEQVMAAIDEYSIPLVLFHTDNGRKPWTHVAQIAAARRLYPERWQLISGDEQSPDSVLLFRIRGNDAKPADTVKLSALSAPKALAQ